MKFGAALESLGFRHEARCNLDGVVFRCHPQNRPLANVTIQGVFRPTEWLALVVSFVRRPHADHL